jgi:hypothetical protein
LNYWASEIKKLVYVFISILEGYIYNSVNKVKCVKGLKRGILKGLTAAALTAFLSCGINTTDSHGHNKGVVVLAQHGEPVPQEVMMMLSGEVSSGHSISGIPTWYKKQATDYGIKSTVSLDFHPDQYVVPEPLRKKDNRLLNLSGFTDYLRNSDETLREYDFIAIYNVVLTEFQSAIRTAESGLASEPQQSFFLNVVTASKYYVGNSLPDVELFAHEYLHLLGAEDKYETGNATSLGRDCKINPQTGERYLSEDIMCQYNSLESAIISEPTAKEIGWLD